MTTGNWEVEFYEIKIELLISSETKEHRRYETGTVSRTA
jgi:hypothetical protein